VTVPELRSVLQRASAELRASLAVPNYVDPIRVHRAIRILEQAERECVK
jgi:hypothetical protein